MIMHQVSEQRSKSFSLGKARKINDKANEQTGFIKYTFKKLGLIFKLMAYLLPAMKWEKLWNHPIGMNEL